MIEYLSKMLNCESDDAILAKAYSIFLRISSKRFCQYMPCYWYFLHIYYLTSWQKIPSNILIYRLTPIRKLMEALEISRSALKYARDHQENVRKAKINRFQNTVWYCLKVIHMHFGIPLTPHFIYRVILGLNISTIRMRQVCTHIRTCIPKSK